MGQMVSASEKRVTETTGSREEDQFGGVLKCSKHDVGKENQNLYDVLFVMEN